VASDGTSSSCSRCRPEVFRIRSIYCMPSSLMRFTRASRKAARTCGRLRQSTSGDTADV
jgi:hypothetical protein